MVGWAKSLNDEYLNEQQYRMNQVIYLLTMVTVMCLPAQFLTGVFGMNVSTLSISCFRPCCLPRRFPFPPSLPPSPYQARSFVLLEQTLTLSPFLLSPPSLPTNCSSSTFPSSSPRTAS